MKLDTTRAIETPEGIELVLRVAGPVVRSLAWVIDFGIRSIIYVVLLFLLARLGRLGFGILLVSIFILEWFYPILFEVYRQGATPGKKLMKIKVLHELGTPVDWSTSMIRNLLLAVDFLPFLYGFGLMSMLMNKDFKRIGDLAAGTVVVYEDNKMNTFILPKEQPRAMPLALPLEEQQAIIYFAERAPQWPEERAIEVANLVSPLTGKEGKSAIQYLYQLANGLIGHQEP